MVLPVVTVIQGDRDQTHAVPFRTGHQRPAGIAGVAGFQSDTARIASKQLVVVVHGTAADAHVHGRYQACKRRLTQRAGGEHRHVLRAGIMSLLIQPAGVGKGRMTHAELRRLLVHPNDKLFHSAAAEIRNALRRVVSGGQHQAVEQLLHRQLLAAAKVHGRALLEVRVLDCHHVTEAAVLQCDQRRHDLGGTGNAQLLGFVV